jgi:KDO2-lipid IV(A) lauroyltransferase
MPVVLPLWFLPWTLATRLGAFYGAVGALLWHRAFRAGMMNLKRALPELSRPEAEAMTRRVFRNMGRSIAEGLQWSRRFDGTAAIYAHHVAESPDLAAAILAETRAKIFVTAHLGSWEAALMIARRVVGDGGAVIARAVDNRFLDTLVRRVRFRDPGEWIEKRGAVPQALECLRSGRSVAMLLDENGGPRGPFVEFFGRKASTRKTPALLALMTGAPIIVGVAVRRERGLVFRLARIEPPANESAIAETTAAITRQLEAWIREDLEQWRWIHWRWKTRPDGTSETYGRDDLDGCFQTESRPGASEAGHGVRGEA